MPRHAPLPRIQLDPRNEAQLVQAAARRVYEASGATLNDFTPGSPIMALLEGQAFAQSEFLQFANEFPESVLIEWIGPFLGAQRRTGSASIVDVTFTITPRDEQFVIFEGYQMATNAALTGGESIGFVTLERLTIPPGAIEGVVRAASVFRSAASNVSANTIVKSITSLDGVERITNTQSAYGGQDAELSSEVKERFFSLIRRRNPVSQEDWADFFTDALGVGTTVTVLGRRSEKDVYRYEDDYLKTNPSVAFYLLNPDGTPISQAQTDALQNLIRWSLPIEFSGHVYPMEVNDVDIDISAVYDPAKSYAQDRIRLSQVIRDSLFSILTPNTVFPISYNPTVADVSSALATTFPLTLGSSNQFVDPEIKDIKVYTTPNLFGMHRFLDVTPSEFKTGFRVKEKDLAVALRGGQDLYYSALKDFDPQVNDKAFFVNLGDLQIRFIKELSPDQFFVGDVIHDPLTGEIHVALSSFIYDGHATVEELIEANFLTSQKDFTRWGTPGIHATRNGKYDPDVISFDESDSDFPVTYPSTPITTSKLKRPGAPVYVATTDFGVLGDTTDLGTAQTLGQISDQPATINVLYDGQSYKKGTYVKTPNPYELLSGQINKEVCYLSELEGAKELFAYVEHDFFLDLSKASGEPDYVQAIDELIDMGILTLVESVPYQDCQGRSTFSQEPFRYHARFLTGEYIRFRERGGFDSDQLQDCTRISNQCEETPETCKKLIEENLPLPRYFFVLKDFTPYTHDVTKLIEDQMIHEVEADEFFTNYIISVPSNIDITSYVIGASLIANKMVSNTAAIVNGATVEIRNELNKTRAVYHWTENRWEYLQSELPRYRDMFRFAPGDVTTFRSGSKIRSYECNTHLTPILDLQVYHNLGMFKATDADETVKWVDPAYHLEDIIRVTNTDGAESFYRVLSSHTPPEEREVWNDEVRENNPRIEEFYGNLIKIVNVSECSDAIMSRIQDDIGTIKLGTCRVNLSSKATDYVSDVYVWESTRQESIVPALSTSTSQTGTLNPVEYGNGTVAL